ncbi:MAG: hypothetical protein JSW25_04760, partial [Thermoplasmata archaeon]
MRLPRASGEVTAMSRRRVIIVMCLALALSIVASPVSGEEASGTETVYWGDHYAIEMNCPDDSGHMVEWDIRVTDGSPVNVYFMSSGQYREYTNPLIDDFSYDEEVSMFNVTSYSKRTGMWNSQDNYLVIETAGHSAIDHSTVDYEVEWAIDDGPDWEDYCCPTSFVVAGVAGV